jgi:hypothetical protein
MVHGLIRFPLYFRFQYEPFPASMKARSLLILYAFVFSLPALAQDEFFLPTPLARSRIFVEGGAFKPLTFSWNNPDPDFAIQSSSKGYFRIGYDRFGRNSPFFLRFALSRREAVVSWRLDNYSKNTPYPVNEPDQFALLAQQGITEFAGGMGLRIGLGRYLYLRPIVTVGFISKGTTRFTPIMLYEEPPAPPNTAHIEVTPTSLYNRDLAFAATFDLNAGFYLNDQNEIGFSFSFSQYGLSRKNEKGYSGTLESLSTFHFDNQQYIVNTTMLLWGYSLGVHYAFRFNMK